MEPLIDLGATPRRTAGGQFTEAERRALARQVVKLLELWNLDKAMACEMLGLSANTRTTLNRYAQGAPLADQRDLLDRVGNLLGIHKSLRLLFPHNRDLAYRWPTTPNRALAGRRPVDIIAEEGLPGLVALRGYLDHLRGQ